ncbi:MAG: phage tail sheath C-terminal domain-containing protein [Clostridia bacterium]|nr:phage tail sheath C-terminal domain-containing protein [Clostridia bacterium]
MEIQGKTYKAVGTIANKDCKHYVYFNQNGIDLNGEAINAVKYLPSLLGIVASCNVTKGCTNFLCSDLSEVTEVEDIDTAVSNGQLVLTNDIGGVRIVTGINSLVTLNGNTATEDMQYIETVEAMDLIRDDIRTVFKNTYQGRFKNKYKYQLLFIGAVNQYYSQLAAEDILDDEFANKADIDVTEQRSAWLGTGKSEAADWDDDKVKRMAFKRSVFLASNIKVLNCMENLKFTVTLE